MFSALDWMAAWVFAAVRPGVKPCANDLPLGARLPFNPFVLPLFLPLPFGVNEGFPFPGPF